LISTFSLTPVWITAGFVFAATMVNFAMAFPYDLDVVRRAPSLRLAPTIGAVILSVLTVWFYGHDVEAILLLPLATMILSVAVLAIVMRWRRNHSTSPIIREQTAFVGLGSLLAFIPLLVWSVLTMVTGGEVWHELTPVTQIAAVLYVLSVGYAILQYRLLETDRIIPEFAVYVILSVMLLAGYLALTLGLSQLTVDAIAADSPILVAITIGTIVLLFNPVRNYLRNLIDRAMFRQRSNYQDRGVEFSRALSDAVSMGDIYHAVLHELDETVSPTRVFMFAQDSKADGYVALPPRGENRPRTDIVFPRDGGLVQYLSQEQSVLYVEPGQPLPLTVVRDRSRLGVLGTPLLIRLQGHERLHAILAVGARRSGESYSYEDLRFIENLVDQASLAVERAQFVDDLEHRVRIQNVLSQVSQALNFAIDFDTLLELVFAQTSRIIDADHFFITLYDEESDELYFSFYATSDERLGRLENIRWKASRDVISEVATRQVSKRVKNFSEEQTRLGFALQDKMPELHAWMGVPMRTDTVTRGRGVLGVMAVGSTEFGSSFSDEQLQLFQDIANIAASAIDKTQLFQKTEIRAAQLKALNDISSKLASELEDVNRLLQTITDDAVQILNCEAGSLGLVEETTGDIIFRVVTGGGGEDLIGRRIRRDAPSLMATVIKSAQTEIVNDAARDERWGGEVDEADIQPENGQEEPEGEKPFVTRALLTIPLIAQGEAVGALQLINKRDGSHFSEEDAFLATTFAGQAAAAIQNARLFEMQDQELLHRVQELEGMAQFDHSLNQTLILDQLVDVIMNWALERTKASNGALLLLTEDREALRLIASYGYEEDSDAAYFLPSMVGETLPRDTGILGRVLETGRPSMIIDPENDPLYVESLPGCRAQIAIPLVRGAEVTGVAMIETAEDGALTLLDMDFLGRLIERASAAISNALLYSQLEQQQAARAEFVSFIAHELKTPITSMKGYTSLLMRGVVGELTEQQSKFLRTVHSNVEMMDHLVNDIRDIEIIDANRQLSLQMEAVNFNDVLRESIGTVQQAFEDKNQTVALTVPEDLPQIWADMRRLGQIMINFLTNANKYSDDGGEIEIGAESTGNQWDTQGARNVLHIWVADDGYGISEEDKQRLFEKYFRSTNQRALNEKGTGLGLTLTRRLIEQHGGTLWFESELGVGTTFHFTIPLAADILSERPSRAVEL
jgi:signal transduction histidine kinase